MEVKAKIYLYIPQLIAIAIRADIPFGLDLLPLFWKNLVGLKLDPVTDLQEADLSTYNYIKMFEMVSEFIRVYVLQTTLFAYA